MVCLAFSSKLTHRPHSASSPVNTASRRTWRYTNGQRALSAAMTDLPRSAAAIRSRAAAWSFTSAGGMSLPVLLPPRAGIFDVLVEPRDLLGQDVLGRFAGGV